MEIESPKRQPAPIVPIKIVPTRCIRSRTAYAMMDEVLYERGTRSSLYANQT